MVRLGFVQSYMWNMILFPKYIDTMKQSIHFLNFESFALSFFEIKQFPRHWTHSQLEVTAFYWLIWLKDWYWKAKFTFLLFSRIKFPAIEVYWPNDWQNRFEINTKHVPVQRLDCNTNSNKIRIHESAFFLGALFLKKIIK